MSRWARRKVIDKFEREWNDDTSYIRDMIDARPRAAWLFSRVTHLLAAAALLGGVGWRVHNHLGLSPPRQDKPAPARDLVRVPVDDEGRPIEAYWPTTSP